MFETGSFSSEIETCTLMCETRRYTNFGYNKDVLTGQNGLLVSLMAIWRTGFPKIGVKPLKLISIQPDSQDDINLWSTNRPAPEFIGDRTVAKSLSFFRGDATKAPRSSTNVEAVSDSTTTA
jgi:hypothetical protein